MSTLPPPLWTADEALADLPALEGTLGPLAPAERPRAAARWFAERYGEARGAAVFVIFVRLCRLIVQQGASGRAQTVDRPLLERILSRLGTGTTEAVSEVPAPLPPEDKPEP